jgi:uncharacterized protein (DUF305 family)
MASDVTTPSARDDAMPAAAPAQGAPVDEQDDDDVVLPWWYSWWRVALIAIAATLLVVGLVAAARDDTPGAGSVDVGYLQDMRAHHDQAVQMGMTYLALKDTNPALRTIAGTIVLDQQLENGMMVELLSQYGAEEENSSGTAMTWMNQPVPIARMPGMASEADLDRLAASSGAAADKLFTELMVAHHEGGIHMAQYAADHAGTGRVRELARAAVRNQTEEIAEIQKTLQTGV